MKPIEEMTREGLEERMDEAARNYARNSQARRVKL
jgi:hypothetical protein